MKNGTLGSFHWVGALVLSLYGCLGVAENEDEGGLNSATFEGLEWRSIGPAFMSGRIADIAILPDNPNIRYIAGLIR